jgi:hypothetical protein
MTQNEFEGGRQAVGYSSLVRLYLVCEGQTYDLAQIAPNSVTLRKPAELPPGNAEVVMVVDGDEHRWPVVLEHGAVPFELDVATVDR